MLTEYRQAIEDAEARLERLTREVTEVVSTWSMAPVIAAYQAVRGVAFLTAVTFVAEIGDVRRFDTPRQLMAYLGLVPSENSTGERVRRGSITKAGNRRARRVLIEGAWVYRFPARISPHLQERLNGLPKRASGILVGRPRPAAAAATVGSWRRANAGPSWSRQSHARCRLFSGPSDNKSRRMGWADRHRYRQHSRQGRATTPNWHPCCASLGAGPRWGILARYYVADTVDARS